MHIIVFFGRIILLSVRILGLIASIDFFLENRERKFIYLQCGWLFWIIAGIIPFFVEQVSYSRLADLLLLVDSSIANLAVIFIGIGIISHFMKTKLKENVLVSVSSLIIPYIIYYFEKDSAISTFVFLMEFYLMLIVLFILTWLSRKKIQELIGSTIYWLYGTIIFGITYPLFFLINSIEGNPFNLYGLETEAAIISNYFWGILFNTILVVLIIQLEHSIADRYQYRLKDKYSHQLGNILQILENANYLIINAEGIKPEELSRLKNLVDKKWLEASTILKEIRYL